MAISAVTQIRDGDLGLYLKILSIGAVYNQLNTEHPMWDAFKAEFKKGAERGGEVRWNVRTAQGDGAFQFVPQVSGAFPKGHKSTLVEPKGYYKSFAATIELPIDVVEQAKENIAAYGKPIAEEVEAKFTASRRQLSASLNRDGTGVIGELSAASASTSADTITLTLKNTDTARSFIGWIMQGDKLKIYRINAGAEVSATVNASGTPATPDYFLVTSVNRSAGTAVVKPYTSAGAAIDITHALASTDVQADDYIRRYGEKFQDLASITASNDYNGLSYEWPGLESLSADDGRLVHNMTMSGALAGTRYDCSNGPISFQDFQKALSQVKLRVGQNRYKYNAAYMAPETYDALVESQQTDRRFTTVTDHTKGVTTLKYMHRKDSLEFEVDEFVPFKRVWILPKGDALCYYGSDVDYVKAADGGPFHLKLGSGSTAGQYEREVQAFLEGRGLAFSQHNAAILVLHNFTNS